MVKFDRSYLVKRASEELAAAERATSPSAAKIHRELAQRYSAMSEEQDPRAGTDALFCAPSTYPAGRSRSARVEGTPGGMSTRPK